MRNKKIKLLMILIAVYIISFMLITEARETFLYGMSKDEIKNDIEFLNDSIKN